MEPGAFGLLMYGPQFSAQLYLYAGVLLLGCSAAIVSFLYLRLRDTGRNYILLKLLTQVLGDYLRVRSQYGWSPWPAYLVWPTAIAGWVLFIVGVTRL
jgi:hypothetical protein